MTLVGILYHFLPKYDIEYIEMCFSADHVYITVPTGVIILDVEINVNVILKIEGWDYFHFWKSFFIYYLKIGFIELSVNSDHLIV